eukprot:scaffold272407_cov37-Tisochrysis_lutea.AAC.5
MPAFAPVDRPIHDLSPAGAQSYVTEHVSGHTLSRSAYAVGWHGPRPQRLVVSHHLVRAPQFQDNAVNDGRQWTEDNLDIPEAVAVVCTPVTA